MVYPIRYLGNYSRSKKMLPKPNELSTTTYEAKQIVVDIWERNKELIRKRTDIGEHFTREVIQSIVFIFLPRGERVHLTNRSITTNL